MITVIVPTFNRPESLKRAVRSLFAQTLVPSGFTIIIVDNTPSATAAAAIAELERECPSTLKLVILHEPNPGVANARNTAMTVVKGSLVAFLDDDQSAPEDWLEQLLRSFARFPAAVTFGPVKTALPEGVTKHKAYFEAFFAREPDLKSGYIAESFGCGNALVDFSQIKGHAPWFDTQMNEMGGEDDLLFARVHQSDGHFVWAGSAPVFEHPPADRVHLRYTLKRAFAYGQSPLTLAIKSTPKRYHVIPFWMAVGLGKGAWHGLKWLTLRLRRDPERAFELDRAIRGFAKLAWWIDVKFYGAAALKKAAPKSKTPMPDPVPHVAKQA